MDMHILPGFDGHHKDGGWLPLRITLASVDEDMTGEVAVEVQASATEARQIYSVPADLRKATRKVQYLYVLPESFRRNLRVKLIDAHGKEVLRKNVPLIAISPEDSLIVVVARNSGGLEYLAEHPQAEMQRSGINPDPTAQSRKVYISYSTALPDRWKGYDSVDTVLLGEVSVSLFSAHQQRAITDWVYGGGSLVVSGGAHSQDLMGTFIEELLPVKISGTRVLDSISSLPQQFGWDMGEVPMVVASSELTDTGRIIAAESNGLPIIAEKEMGDGRAIFLAFDYLDPALRAWGGKRTMWERLLPQQTPDKRPRDTDIARLLSANRTVRLPSYKFTGLFLLLYILCFGPLNYFILKRFNKGEWMWLTMPAIAAAFTIGALGFTYATRRGATVVNDLSVVDIYQNIGRARISSYFSLFSPAKSDYRIEFSASDAVFVNRMPSPDKRTSQDGDCKLVEKATYQMEVLRMEPLSPLSFHGESYVDLSGSVSLNLSESSEGVAHGKVISDLPFDLTDCYVVSNGRYAYIGDLTRGAGAQARLDRAHSGSILGLYSTRGGEKRQFINAMRQNLSRNVPSAGVIGWMKESALKTLVEMNVGEDYRALGVALVTIHL